jgi:NACHT domain
MLLDVLGLYVGTAVAKAIVKTWLHDSHFVTETSVSLLEIFGKLGVEYLTSRRLSREFDEVADKVAETLLPFFEKEGASLDDGDKEAVAIALSRAITQTDIGPQTLVSQFDLRTETLAATFASKARHDLQNFSEDATSFFHKSAFETARYVIEAAARLPGFTPNAFNQVLERQRSILTSVEEVLSELRRVREASRALNPAEEMAHFEERYRIGLAHKYDEIELFGLEAPTNIRRQNLTIAYITLSMVRRPGARTARRNAKSAKFHPLNPRDALTRIRRNVESTTRIIDSSADLRSLGGAGRADREGPELADTILATSPRLLIRGEAGSGKTTLLQWAAVSVASQRLRRPLDLWNSCIPILVRLRDYGEKAFPSLEQIIRDSMPAIGDALPHSWIQQVFNERGILLIDGVDELDEGKRDDVRVWLSELISHFPECRYILTSRPGAIEDEWLEKQEFEEAELLPMSWNDIDALIDHWHYALGDQAGEIGELDDDLRRAAQRLKMLLRNTKSLRTLATTPLLCAMLCALHYLKQQELPANRLSLYDAAVRMLLDQRDRARRIGPLSFPQLNEEQKRAFLEHIAYWMLRNGVASTSIDQARDEIRKRQGVVQNLPTDATAEIILDLLLQRSGILRSPSQGSVDFVHKTSSLSG